MARQSLDNSERFIEVKGARVHNLKDVSLKIPKNKLIVFTGLSGSGKSSLAFDTLYAEGQRRYVESLSSYARQFLGVMDKPDVDSISGLSPSISIDQKSSAHSPRSTVGTVTEVYDYLRLLFSKIGTPHCPNCGDVVHAQTLDEIRKSILSIGKDSKVPAKVYILAPIVKNRKGTYLELFNGLLSQGYVRVRVNGRVFHLEEEIKLSKNKKHTIEVVVDRISLKKRSVYTEDEYLDLKKRILDALEASTNMSDGEIIAAVEIGTNKWDDSLYSEHNHCPKCDIYVPELTPSSFSFNSPQGACERCNGIGYIREIDPKLVYNPKLTVEEGGIFPWSRLTSKDSWQLRILREVAKQEGFDLNTRLGNLPEDLLRLLLYGSKGKAYTIEYTTRSGHNNRYTTKFEGVVNNLERRYLETNSEYIRTDIEKYMRDIICPICDGKRLKDHVLAVTVSDLSIDAVTELPIDQAYLWSRILTGQIKPSKKPEHRQIEKASKLSGQDYEIAKGILQEILTRLSFLSSVGLSYLTLSRSARTLSGGESQRIRLASQIGTGLTGVLYVLDEPSIGLHQSDNQRLLATLEGLRDLGNTIVVVEHDEETMHKADWLVDIGPGAGEHGGQIVFNDKPSKIGKAKTSTAEYLSGKKIVGSAFLDADKRRSGSHNSIKILNAHEHNLKNLDVEIPLNKLVAVTGISGSGKSTLIHDILFKTLLNEMQGGRQVPGRSDGLEGTDNIDKVIDIDQSPIGRTPRSNPATYTGVFTHIRNLFTDLPESKTRGYKAGRFSFNVKGGRCEHCAGDGVIKIEMQFLPDVYVECEVCKGKRYSDEVLQIDFKGKNISQILNMTVEEALGFFDAIPAIRRKLETLDSVGLSYIKLGQPATQLSGGEAQRIKLATELSKLSRGNTLYILDEPTTGLHFADIDRLLDVLHALVDKGHSVLVIEHNLDVIKTADWVIDLGPKGGDYGGEIVAVGTPEQVAQNRKSLTGEYLQNVLKK